MRTTKDERAKNARQFYTMLQNYKKAAIVIQRNESTSNPYVNRVQFLSAVGSASGVPVVIAESASLGVDGCFIEMFENLGAKQQLTCYEDGFNDWVRKNFHFRITYKDGYVMMFEWC